MFILVLIIFTTGCAANSKSLLPDRCYFGNYLRCERDTMKLDKSSKTFEVQLINSYGSDIVLEEPKSTLCSESSFSINELQAGQLVEFTMSGCTIDESFEDTVTFDWYGKSGGSDYKHQSQAEIRIMDR